MYDSRHSVLEALKRGAREASVAMSFTLRKKDYASILDKIKNGNSTLQNLALQNTELEPTRRSGSQFKLARLIRELSHGIFTAFQSVFDCNCNSHDLGLEIAPRKATILPDQGRDGVAKSLEFDIVVNMDDQVQTKRWDRVRVQLADSGLSPVPTEPHSPPSTTSSSPPRPKSPRRVKFTSFISGHLLDRNALSITGDGHISSQLPASKSALSLVSPTPIKNLCNILQADGEPACDCYGTITDASRKFNLYAKRCHPHKYIAVQLRKVLEEQKLCTRRFDYPERLKVALALSYSVFHHYNTPWLSKVITADDVLFFREEPIQNMCASNYLEKPLLTKQLPTRLASTASAPIYHTADPNLVTTRRINWTLLSLGFLLIQIILGSTVDDLDITMEIDLECLLEKQAKASELSGGRHVLTNGGPNYAAAAQWCLNNFLNGASLDDEAFCHEFHGEVIDRLETDLKHQSIRF